MTVAADQVVITAGGLEALTLVVGLLRGQTRRLRVEDPCYVGASTILAPRGSRSRRFP